MPRIIKEFKKTQGIPHDKRDKIISYGGFLLGLLFIIASIVYLNSPVEKVADNVVFGEHAVIATFLMILGILIIVVVLKDKIISKTPLGDIYTQMKAIENEKDKKDEKNKSE
ncbi:MAG TPA: hypothetical protein PLO64_01055 [Methanothermobacter sp.]|mgnify:CR=1 FL=1|nr:conserved hypothetical protein [Methanothermobacter sp. MT-2]HHW04795.1 hypothetical protein [Methanothermobacter sp.]HOK72194.1 hypothetical protein [Methanothermobacter sp.]HOL68507.1 hypothetical protein [Methanothermobacter sp.]HPQ04266.1 hypothetical protein [Methanothermobacter sp.]